MELNEKLISLRKKNKLTQAQVAEALDVSRQAISNWETGTVLPSTDNLIALSRLYQVPADHLLNDDSDLIPVPVEEKEVDKKEETPPEPAKSTTYSKLDILRKHGVIILLYLLTLFLVVLISVSVTLFLTREKEPDVLDVSDLNIEYVDPATVEDGSFW
ncbi:helix-turn-helix domain-containing protein [Lawsonibacter sp. DFI.6.74]|nr:helix-turn-helix domain-containing protein [Lawsonibacter sp. DFI.6.74]MCG4771536.1 helix-turn-helix domain-containing protein [Lawsonibacter sp. DFI.5.51]